MLKIIYMVSICIKPLLQRLLPSPTSKDSQPTIVNVSQLLQMGQYSYETDQNTILALMSVWNLPVNIRFLSSISLKNPATFAWLTPSMSRLSEERRPTRKMRSGQPISSSMIWLLLALSHLLKSDNSETCFAIA